MKLGRRKLGLLFCVVAIGCASPRDRLPDIAHIYEKAALNEARNPVVVIHGILGSRLAKPGPAGQSVWGAFTGNYADPATREGARAIALPMDGTDEDVVATGPLGQLKLDFLFGIISVNIYRDIIRTLGAGGYKDKVTVDPNTVRYAKDHFTCHSFWYDWRQDNVQGAIQLGRFLREKRKEIIETARSRITRLREEEATTPGHEAHLREAQELEDWLARGFRFDIVAHSMGGLLARYYLRYGDKDLPTDGSEPEVTWAGAKEIDRLILVAPPNLGSMEALDQLILGYEPSFLLPFYDPAILGTMPSIYQLLPRLRQKLVLDAREKPAELDFMDPRVWRDNQWGLMDPAFSKTLAWLIPGVDPERRRQIAYRYLESMLTRARAFQHALDKKPARPSPAEIFLFAADSQPTLARTVLRAERTTAGAPPRIRPTFPNDDRTTLPGDGTVTRYSALGDERQGGPYQVRLRSHIPWTSQTFLSDDHIGLTKNPHFSDNILYLLLERPLPRR